MFATDSQCPISGLLPIKDGLSYLDNLRRCVEDNLLPCDEMVIIDDHSRDGTHEYLNSWADANNQIRVFSNPGSGLVDALNFGFSVAHHDWVARFDADDEYSHLRIKMQRREIKDGIGVIFSDYLLTTFSGHSLGSLPSAVYSSPMKVSLAASQRTPHPVALINKTAFQSVGGYLRDDFPIEDLSLWLRLSKHYLLVGVPLELLHYQINPSSITANFSDEMHAKRKLIYATHTIPRDAFEECISGWRDFFKSYDSLSHPAKRKILFFHDLRAYAKLYPTNATENRELRRVGRYLLCRPIILLAGVRLIIEKLKRDAYRR